MNNWSQNPNNMVIGSAQFNPYSTPVNWYGNSRAPVYSAVPIHGEAAAWQFPMGPNSEIYLPDADEDIIWWIRTDNMGNRMVQDFDIKPRVKPAPIDTSDLAARLAAVEEWINAKSNKSNAKRANNAPTAVSTATADTVAATTPTVN